MRLVVAIFPINEIGFCELLIALIKFPRNIQKSEKIMNCVHFHLFLLHR